MKKRIIEDIVIILAVILIAIVWFCFGFIVGATKASNFTRKTAFDGKDDKYIVQEETQGLKTLKIA